MPVLNRLADVAGEIAEWRRDIHRHPELSFDVHRTAALVAEKLRAFGCDEVVEGIGRTGVVGLVRGRATDSGRVIGLRADMDALPIHEETGADYASETPGRMHACGHDGHTAMLLGAARHLCETRAFDGSVALIFQPAEEAGGGGEAMVRDGMMERFGIQRVWAIHNHPGLPVGAFAITSGPALAACDEFDVTITGRGGHGARPHWTVDPVLAASEIVIALQSIVARGADPLAGLVLTVTALDSDGDTYNVIPQRARLRGTVRSFTPEMRATARARLDALVGEMAAGFGCGSEIVWDPGYPPMVNTHDEAMFAADVAEEISGACIRDAPPQMGSEDFSYMLEARPGAMISLGNGDSQQCHHPAYDFADDAIPAGCSFWVRLAERALAP